jgi:hypothetical protein
MPIPVAKKAARDSRYRGVIYGLAPGLDFALCRALDLLLGLALAAGAALSLALLSAAFAKPANAAEGATQFYLLGLRANAAAGITPPPGVYIQNDFYIYDGKAGGGRIFPTGGQLIVDINARAYAELPTFLWVTPANLFGGSLAFSVTPPIGGPHISAGSVLASPLLGAVIGTNVRDQITTFGDPVLSGMLGWHAGNFHWQLGTAVNVPVGDYREGAIANLAFNRWMADFFATATWFDRRSASISPARSASP